MAGFGVRSGGREHLDDACFSLSAFRAYMDSLERANRASLAYRPILSWLDRELRGRTPGARLTLVDAGCGQGGLLRAIWRRFGGRGLNLELSGLDLHPLARPCARALTPGGAPIRYVTADFFDRPELLEADYVVSSLVAHHLDDGRVVDLLRLLEERAARGWLVSDLNRHPLACLAACLGLALLGAHPLVRKDAALSFRRAFDRADWQALLDRAGLSEAGVRVSPDLPFRYLLTRHKHGPPLEAA